MCGICGVIDYGSKNRVSESLIRSMCRKMVHRGPDDEGVYTAIAGSGTSVGLGHRRLKIIDLSPAGHQPMSNENRTVWIVFNGEIYNYKELKLALTKKGHLFQSATDTECVIHLYEEYGEDCLRYLRGMFAFAIWDAKKEILVLARDRAGKKPLLYYHKQSKFYFASEFSALLASGFTDRGVNLEAVNYYLSFGYIPAPLTIYRDIFKLPPAHMLILKDNMFTIKKYWELNYKEKIRIPEQEAERETLRLLKEAVKIRLYSDVPLGAFLSGGIDSSTVVALMAQLSVNKVKTFSIGFEEGDYNELKYARNIAERFATEHNEFIVRPEALKILPLLVERYGEPYADSSCIPTYYVAQQTSQYVTVALNGDGGDELFAGYERYQAMLIAEKISNMAKGAIRGFSAILPDSANPKNTLRRIKRFCDGAILPLQQRYIKWISIFDDDSKRNIYSEDFAGLIDRASVLNFIKPFMNIYNGASLLDSLLFTDTLTYLPYDLLVKVDITSMANSLETRSPFLDQKLMEFAARLPAEYKIKRFTRKYVLKKTIKDLIPRGNIYRRKMGFGVPIGKWLRCELNGFLRDALLSSISLKRGYFKPEVVKTMINDHSRAKRDYAFQLWALLMLELWHNRFID